MKFCYLIFLLLNALLKIVFANTDMQKVHTLLSNQQTEDTQIQVKKVDLPIVALMSIQSYKDKE